MTDKVKPQTHISWPVCSTCAGTGGVPRKGGNDTGSCGTCDGTGRVMPEGWKAPIWAPDGLIDAGSDPELLEAVKEGRITLVRPAAAAKPGKDFTDEIGALKKRIAELEKKAS